MIVYITVRALRLRRISKVEVGFVSWIEEGWRQRVIYEFIDIRGNVKMWEIW